MLLMGYIVLLMVTLRGAAAADTACRPPPREPVLEVQGSWDQESYPSGTIAIFTCRPGYFRLGLIRKVCRNGQWQSISSGRCVNVGTCGRPLRYIDMELQGDWDEESYPADKVATFACRPGYTQLGIIEKSCVGGEWKPVSNGRCQLKSCGPPGDIESGSFELVEGDELVFGAVVKYTCDKGYKMVSGHNIRECRANGWTNNLPKCQDVNVCDPPPRAPELEVKGIWDAESYPVGTEVTFACRPGYIQQGDIKKVCVDASWRDAPGGTCRKKPCGPPGDLQFGSFKLTSGDDFVFGAVVQYTCNKGYKMEENGNTRECTNDGWTNAVPQCKVNKDPCGRPPAIRHGDFLEPGKVRYEVGSSLVYQCPNYYKMQGSATVTCLGGDWSDPPGCLEPCTVTVDAMSERNIQLKVEGAQKIYVRHQDRIEFMCIQEYEISDINLLQVTCNRGMFQYPKCIKTGSCILSQAVMDSRNIYINRNSEILPEETVRFECKEGTLPEKTLEGKCNMRNLNYPTCVIPKSCRISVEDLKKKNVDLEWPADDLEKLYKHGAEVRIKCKEGYVSPSQAVPLKGQCYDGNMRYQGCFPEQIILLNHDNQKTPLNDYEAYYGAGEEARFVCKQVFTNNAK